MSDFSSSLPTRTESPGDIQSKISDGTTPSQFLAVDASGKITTKLNDGSGTAITSQASGAQRPLDTSTLVGGVIVDPRQVRALTAADVVTANQGSANTIANGWPVKPTDGTNSQTYLATGEAKVSVTQPLPTGTNSIGQVTVNNAAGAAAVNIQDGGNSITVDGAVSATNFPSTVDTNYGTVGASTIRVASQVGNVTGAANYNNGATGAQTLRVAANLAVAGADVSALNPIPVVFSADPSGSEINDYKTVVALASTSTDNHDYTVTVAKTFILTQILAAATGKMKVEVQIESAAGSGTFATKYVFFNSTATTNINESFKSPIQVVAGARVRLIVTNTDKQAQDVYSTICGEEVP